ncbi:hypothetical protein [Arthrobacter woluwensis]|uniref:hypothetical protein n=1 Tax=Arthrobacter woluwensis TaxID=156980 RepID=UPI0011A3D329|nr:hypothetical protein [Arthrobacter woluwensis]
MSTVVLTKLPAIGAIRLAITPPAGGAILQVQRTDVNGTAVVRTLTGQLPYSGTTPLVLDDYEAATGQVTYTIGATGQPGPDVVTTSFDLGEEPWLGLPITPQYSVQVPATIDYDSNIESRTVVHEPVGSRFPIVVSQEASTRRGQMTVFAGSYAVGLSILRMFQRGQVAFLRQNVPGMDMYFSITTASLRTLVTEPFTVSVDISYIEVGRPTGPLAGALGWTWTSLKNSLATWADVTGTYATWADVRTDTKRP